MGDLIVSLDLEIKKSVTSVWKLGIIFGNYYINENISTQCRMNGGGRLRIVTESGTKRYQVRLGYG